MPTRIYLVRHAETETTEEDRFAGHADLPLSPAGREHAGELSTRLESFQLDAAYASSLHRAMETAEIIAAPHQLHVTPVPGLIEISHGHWEGLKRQEVEQRFPDEYAAYERDPFDAAPAGGETGRQVIDRAVPALLAIVRAHPEGKVLVVSHKATNRLLIGHFLGIDLRHYRDLLGQRATCLNLLDFSDPEHAKLMLLDDVSHYEICAPPEDRYVV